MNAQRFVVISIVMLFGPGLWAARDALEPFQISSDRQLLLDDRLVDRWGGLSLRLHSPVRREPAISIDFDWESSGVSYMVTFEDEGRFRAWYRCDGAAKWVGTCYAESRDGIRWTKPKLNLVPYKGSMENNIVLEGGEGHHVGFGGNLSLLKDPRPEVPADHRYKGIVNRGRGKIFGLHSADGLRWKQVKDAPLIDSHPTDSHNIVVWDPVGKQYAIYLRGAQRAPSSPKDLKSWQELGVRAVRRAVSRDFLDWSTPELIDTGSNPVEHFYTNAVVAYERAPSTFLMFPSRFVVDRMPDPNWPHGSGVSDIVFLHSYDGFKWRRSFLEAFLRPGPDPGTWHERALYMERGILRTSAHELSMYAMHNIRMNDNHIRRLTLRVDGFASLHGDYQGGIAVTRSLEFTGKELEVNFATSAVGSARFEIRDGNNNPLPGYAFEDCEEMFGDSIERPVTWRGTTDVSSLRGRSVRLHIALKDADLFSFRFR